MRQRFDNLMELVGLALLVLFGYLVWAPAALLISGVLLFLSANIRAGRRRRVELAAAATAEGRAPATPVPLLDRLLRVAQAWRSAR